MADVLAGVVMIAFILLVGAEIMDRFMGDK